MSLALVLATAFVTRDELGGYVERTLYLRTAFQTLTTLGLGPKVHPDLRLVLLDDRSLNVYGKHPTFGDWQKIAQILFDLGFERVLFGGYFHVQAEVGELAETHPPPSWFGAGAVAYRNETALEGPRGGATLPVERFLPYDGAPDDAYPDARFILGASPEVAGVVDGFGTLNMTSDVTVPLAFSVGDGHLIPHLGLHAAPGLRVEGGRLVSERGALPAPPDGEIYLEYPQLGDALKQALPASVFFTRTSGRVSPNVPEGAKRILAGGRVALLVPSAYSGGRHVLTPFGAYPGYMPFVSVASGALWNRFVYIPVQHDWLIIGAALLALLLASLPSLRFVLISSGALLAVVVAASLALLVTRGWFLPAYGMGTVVLVALAVRLGYFGARAWVERMLTRRDLEMGRAIQALLLPQERAAELGGWSYRIVFEPYGAMSGDWYQTWHAKDANAPLRCVLAIGDVVGKGPSAALNTATIASVWKAHERRWDEGVFDLPALLGDLDEVIRVSYRGAQCTTALVVAVFADKVQVISVASPIWLQVKPTGEILRHRNKPVNPLGTQFGNARYKLLELAPEPGDVLVGHTDGVMEGEAFTKFAAAVKARAKDGGALSYEALAELAKASGRGSVLPDDVTLLMVRREKLAELLVISA